MKIRSLTTAVLLAMGLHGAGHAQDAYPAKPIRLVCVHAPGGSADTLARLIADKLAVALGQSVVVENKPGGGTALGASQVAKSPADGYTLLMASVTTLSINPSTVADLPYDPVKDFAPVAAIAAMPALLAVSPTLPVKNVQELLALAKAQPGKLNFSSPGTGTSAHLAGELFAAKAGIDIVHVPYRGSSLASTDLISGRVQMTFENSLVPLSHAGKLRAIGIGSAKRSSVWPELPTIAEQGVPGYESTVWYGVVAPAGTPEPIVHRLNAEINKILAMPDVKQPIQTKLFGDALGGSEKDFADLIARDKKKWAEVIKTAHIEVE